MTGQGTFIDGLRLPELENAVHAVFVRSIEPHGRLVSIDSTDAAAMLTASTVNNAPAHGTAGHTASATASDADACALGNVFAWMVVRLTQDRLKRRNAA